jgi:hypothetical protein
VTAIDITVRMSEADAHRLSKEIRLLAGSVRNQLEKIKLLIDKAEAGEAHLVLGFRSWTAYVADVLGELHLHLDRGDRRELVTYLSGKGMSTRAIAGAVDVSKNTVTADLQVSQSGTPEPEGWVPSTPLSQALMDGRLEGDAAAAILAMPGSDEEKLADLESLARPEGAVPDRNSSLPAKVIGTDGKTYQTKMPAAPRRRRPLPDAFLGAILDLGKVAGRITRLSRDDRFGSHAAGLSFYRNDLIRARDALQAAIDLIPEPEPWVPGTTVLSPDQLTITHNHNSAFIANTSVVREALQRLGIEHHPAAGAKGRRTFPLSKVDAVVTALQNSGIDAHVVNEVTG